MQDNGPYVSIDVVARKYGVTPSELLRASQNGTGPKMIKAGKLHLFSYRSMLVFEIGLLLDDMNRTFRPNPKHE